MAIPCAVVVGAIAFLSAFLSSSGAVTLESFPFRNVTHNHIIPVPSAAQLRYQSTDFVALIHFNMATYAKDGDPGCDSTNWNQKAPRATGPTSDKQTFQPVSLNTTQWFDSITALGAKIAVLTAKHGCGFLLWPTNATLPQKDTAISTLRRMNTQTTPRDSSFTSSTTYGYHTDFDLLQDFVDSAKAAGVGFGFYYSIMKNFFLCRSYEGKNSCQDTLLEHQHNVTDAEYHSIVRAHLQELWTNYGNLAEVWIDSRLQGFGDLLDKLQPTAGGTPSNPRQWCGTESGFPSRDVGQGPIWQTGDGFFGDSTSQQWVDKFCDPQLFEDHIWFYEPNRKVKTLEELIPIYHDIVGRGMVMELAFAINREGLVEASHERVYKQLGKWVEECYGRPFISKQNIRVERTMELRLPDDTTASLDRIVLQEDIALGQRIRNYTIDLVCDDGESIPLVADGTSVGRKRIHILGSAATRKIQNRCRSQSVVLTIKGNIGPTILSMFGLYESCFPESEF